MFGKRKIRWIAKICNIINYLKNKKKKIIKKAEKWPKKAQSGKKPQIFFMRIILIKNQKNEHCLDEFCPMVAEKPLMKQNFKKFRKC